MKKIIIAIDGYSSCGKSTLAKALAKEIGYVFIDSGAMYRAITLYFLRHNVPVEDSIAVSGALENIALGFALPDADGNGGGILLNGENVATEIRNLSVSGSVSKVAAIKEVRDFSVAQQQRYRQERGVVMDGRDIGTIVFPDAELKIFVTAKPEIRVERRYQEMLRTDAAADKEAIRQNLESRDYQDTHREIGPLRQAEDAVVLDNSDMTREEQLQWALSLVHARAGGVLFGVPGPPLFR